MTAEQQRVINILAPLAVKYGAMHNVVPSLTLSQAILESGWLKSCIGGFACFGVKGKGMLCTTQEYINGEWKTIKDNFVTYNSYEDSFKGYYAFLENNPRYRKNGVFGEWNYQQACKNIFKAGYATGKDYDLTLIGIINQFKLYEYDKQALALRNSTYINPVPSPTPQPISTTSTKKITISSANWNIRSAPSLTASIIKQINGGQYTSSKSIYGWYYIDSLNGYIVDKSVVNVEDVLSTFSISFTDVSTQSEINGIVDRVAQIGYKNHNITTQPTGSLTVTFTDISSQGEVDNLANIIGNFGYKNHVIRNS